MRLLNISLDLSMLDEEIERARKLEGSIRGIEARRALRTDRLRRMEERRVSYIS